MEIYGYVRVSTKDQNPEKNVTKGRQQETLKYSVLFKKNRWFVVFFYCKTSVS